MTYAIIGLLILAAVLYFSKSKAAAIAPEATFQSVSANEAREMIKSSKPVILDVRTPMEVSGGKINQALAINVASPSFRSEVSKLDKTKAYIVYCRSGRRSVNACKIMAREGFVSLYNLEGGFNTWK